MALPDRADQPGIPNHDNTLQLSIGLRNRDHVFVPILPAGIEIPAVRAQAFEVSSLPFDWDDGRFIASLQIFQGERLYCPFNSFLGEILIGPIGPWHRAHGIRVTMEIRENGYLTATAHACTYIRIAALVLETYHGDINAIDKGLRSAAEGRKEDCLFMRTIEMRNELLDCAHSFLEVLLSEIDPDNRFQKRFGGKELSTRNFIRTCNRVYEHIISLLDDGPHAVDLGNGKSQIANVIWFISVAIQAAFTHCWDRAPMDEAGLHTRLTHHDQLRSFVTRLQDAGLLDH